ncbi:hypothetical protein CFIO01_03639 [Colletotrichum fioriniae PJ7]|uniref:Uncharacterized protein n=1 Tax=Colletotrichum fioriniae PJ7 TaxID=1445577 RepID=A0A010QHV5_9PEZI|nr:hypothetical protein CFIO01_03639 [Colletotrichum fioriniae PJ7]
MVSGMMYDPSTRFSTKAATEPAASRATSTRSTTTSMPSKRWARRRRRFYSSCWANLASSHSSRPLCRSTTAATSSLALSLLPTST